MTSLYLYRQGYMFWIEGTRKTIMRSYLNGSDPTVLVDTGLATPGEIMYMLLLVTVVTILQPYML